MHKITAKLRTLRQSLAQWIAPAPLYECGGDTLLAQLREGKLDIRPANATTTLEDATLERAIARARAQYLSIAVGTVDEKKQLDALRIVQAIGYVLSVLTQAHNQGVLEDQPKQPEDQ